MKQQSVTSHNDCYTLNNGVQIPCIGFGTYNAEDGDNYEIIRTAIEAGYRYFDTASFYETERVLGKAIKESGIDRKDFFLVSKAWTDEMGYENVKAAFARSLERLQTDYLDLYLIHWPKPYKDAPEEVWKSIEIETYRALEELYGEGKIRGIGLSNFLPHHINNILRNCRIKPVVDQLEFHLGYTQAAAVAFCEAHDIRVQAWSPIGRSVLLKEPFFQEMADKYHVSLAQFALRFIVQQGVIPLPKSSTMERMKQNLDIFHFEISEDDMYLLQTMPPTCWLGEHPDFAPPERTSNFNQ